MNTGYHGPIVKLVCSWFNLQLIPQGNGVSVDFVNGVEVSRPDL
jgi:hypothetical protein